MSTTNRLILRPWRPEDRAPFAALNADPDVMEFFVAPMTRTQSDAFVDLIETGFAERGHGTTASPEARGVADDQWRALNPRTS